MGRISTFGQHLYDGRISFDFVGRRKIWYALSALIMIFAVSGLIVRDLNLGVEFKGGVEFTAEIAPTDENVDAITEAVADTGIAEASDPLVTTAGSDAIRVQTGSLGTAETEQVSQVLTDAGATDVSQDSVGPSWGRQVAEKASLGLSVFLVIVVLFIWAYFREWRMSAAAIIALVHDVVITVGVYAWSGFEVTPATVTGLLTILGYSLYDTVVVFDKVRENTRNFERQTRRTYSELANLAVNQTLVRSINTSITALLPVAALLVVGTVTLGTGPLKDLALALFVGMAAGTYSSICIATPLAAQLKEREPATIAHTKRVLAKRSRPAPPPQVAEPAAAAAPAPAARPARPPAAVRKVAPSRSSGRNQPRRESRSGRAKGKK